MSKTTAAGTIGTGPPGVGSPTPRAARPSCTPAAAVRPKALPPVSRIASARPCTVPGPSSAVSRVPGPPPRTSAAARRAGRRQEDGAAREGLEVGPVAEREEAHRDRLARGLRWQRGQKCVPRPPTTVRTMVAPHVSHGSPSRP